MTDAPRVEILMAAYNGEAYVREQVESILRQSYDGWHLTARDDASTDGTLAVLRDLERQHPERIEVQARTANSGSAQRNFLEMLRDSAADYVMFCDDDDVWLENKVAVTVEAMRGLERTRGRATPLLVHSDLSLTDARLTVTAPSMLRARQLDPDERRFARLLLQNRVTGCTVLVNRALADLVDEPFDGIAMHDWWLALVAGAFGEIGFVPAPTVLYRQHGGNAVGARPSRTVRYSLDRLRDRAGSERMRADTFAQAEAFLRRYEMRLSDEQRATLRAYLSLRHVGRITRARLIWRHGFWKNTTRRRLVQLFLE